MADVLTTPECESGSEMKLKLQSLPIVFLLYLMIKKPESNYIYFTLLRK